MKKARNKIFDYSSILTFRHKQGIDMKNFEYNDFHIFSKARTIFQKNNNFSHFFSRKTKFKKQQHELSQQAKST